MFRKIAVILLLSFSLLSAEWVALQSSQPAESEIQVISSSKQRTVLKYEISGFYLRRIEIEGNEYALIRSPGMTTFLEKGFPELPKLYESILIGDIYDAAVRFQSLELDTIDVGIVAPSKGNLMRTQDPRKVPFEFGDLYRKGGVFPRDAAELSRPFIVRDYRGVTVKFHPFRYDAGTKKLIVVRSAQIVVEENHTGSTNPRLSQRRKKSVVFQNLYNSFFINYSTASEQSEQYDFIDEPGKILIICYDNFLSVAQGLADWKNQKGLPTELIPFSIVGSTSADLQSFLQNEYNSDDPFTYVILVGDAEQIPCLYGTQEGAPSDGRYILLEGDDWYADAFISRISAQTVAQAANQIYKFIQYEKYPFETDTDWYRKGTGIASNEDGGTGLYDWERMEILRTELLNFTYDYIDQIYDPGATASQVISAVSEGRSILNYIGHGSGTSWGTSNFNTSSVSQLANGLKQPFIIDVSCLNGRFTMSYDCLAEAWLKGGDTLNPKGAIGMFSSSTSCSWVPPTVMQGEAIDLLVTNQRNTLGGLCAHGVMEVLDEYSGSPGYLIFEQYNLFGDCSLQLRTDIPADITADFVPVIPVGSTDFEVTTPGGEGLLVALSNENHELVGWGITDQTGHADIQFANSLEEPGMVTLTITGFNKRPFIEDIPVIVPNGPWLLVDSLGIADIAGNVNGVPEYSDLLEITTRLKNIGVDTAKSINVILRSQDPFAEVIDSVSLFPDMDSGDVRIGLDGLTVQVSPNTPDSYPLALSLHIVSNDTLVWDYNFSVKISAPEFEISDISILDENGSGLIDPGESGSVIVTVENTGHAGIADLMATFSEEDPYITLSSGIFQIDNLPDHGGASSNEATPLVVSAVSMTPLGHQADLTLSFSRSDGFHREIGLSLMIGHPQVLIWDKDGNHNSGTVINEIMTTSLGLNVDYTTGDIPVGDLPYYKAVFICLGVYPDKYQLSESEAAPLVEYLNGGGAVYMEGGDTWFYDPQTSLHGYFSITATSDGSGDLATIRGTEGSFLDSLSFDYAGDNNYIDRLVPSGNAQSLMENAYPHFVCSVLNQTDTYKTIGASFEIGGINDGSGYNTKEYLLYRILDFFELGTFMNTVCYDWSIGDVNHDELMNVMDIVKIVNIIMEYIQPDTCEKWAADVNQDSTVDVQDIILEVNIVLNAPGRMLSKDNSVKASFVNLVRKNNAFILKSDGEISGLQLQLSADSDISGQMIQVTKVLDGFDVYIAGNGKRSTCLIFSMDGMTIPLNEPLIEIGENITIESAKAVNSLGDAVPAEIVSVPLRFSLSQNYPNPFNPSTTIYFSIAREGHTSLVIYNILGKKVRVLVDTEMKPGEYSVLWKGRDDSGKAVPSGVYFYQLESNGNRAVKKMTFLR